VSLSIAEIIVSKNHERLALIRRRSASHLDNRMSRLCRDAI
jgi:hypothetical protein